MTRILTLLALLATLVVAGCGDESSSSSDSSERLGNPAVYERIDSLTSCAKLQREFDVAMDNVERLPPGSSQRDTSMAYADHAQQRIEALDC